MFIGPQFLQNLLGYDTLEAGAAILPAVFLMVIVAPRSAKLIEARGSRFTLLCGYVCCFLGFLTMLTLWDTGSPYWEVGLAYAFIGAGVGLAGTPASHSLTSSVPVRRAGMASATADLQRDLGGGGAPLDTPPPPLPNGPGGGQSCSLPAARCSPPATQPLSPRSSPVRRM